MRKAQDYHNMIPSTSIRFGGNHSQEIYRIVKVYFIMNEPETLLFDAPFER